MDFFSYFSFLSSIILALGITRLFSGIGTILEHGGKAKLYWVHLLWALNLLLFVVLEWWILYRWRNQTDWNFYLYAFLLLSPAISFLLSVILFPSTTDKLDFKEHFYRNRAWFFSIAALLPPLDAADTLLKGYAHFQAQGPLYVVFLSIVFVLTLLGAIIQNERYHKLFSIFFLAYMLTFIGVNLNILA